MIAVVQVAIGGALGAVLRYGCVQGSLRLFGTSFPAGTLLVNVVGSFVMGLAAVWMLQRLGNERYMPFLMTGLLGGFTTFSAFSLDFVRMWDAGQIFPAWIYLASSVGASIVALMLGMVLMRWIMG